MDYTQEINKLKRELTEVSLKQKYLNSQIEGKANWVLLLTRMIVAYGAVASVLYFSEVADPFLKALVVPFAQILLHFITRFIRKSL